MITQDLGIATAYGYAKSKGYTGTEAEFAELMASYSEVGQTAVDAKDAAVAAKTAAQTAETTATNKATEATTAATTATTKAAEAQADADAAALDASQALSAASTATTKATEATTAAATATSAKTDAVAANTAAQSAKTAAQTAQTGAETAAASVQSSAAQIATNADDIAQLKSELSSETESVYNALMYSEALDIPVTWEYGTINSSGQETLEDRQYYARTVNACSFTEPIVVTMKAISPSTVYQFFVLVEFDKTTHTMTNRTVYTMGVDTEIKFTTDTTKEYRFVVMCESSTVINLTEVDTYATFTTVTKLEELDQTVANIIGTLGTDDNVVEEIEYTATAGFMSTTGTVTPGGTTYGYTDKIDVEEGDIIRAVPKRNGKSPDLRFVTAFKDNTAISAQGASNVTSYTVPSGIKKVVITGYQADEGNADSIPYLFKFTKGYADKSTDSNGFVVRKSSLSTGEQIDVPLNNIAKNTVITFDALVTAFSALDFGRSGYTNKIRVTSTDVIFYDADGTVLSTTAHGLTIANTISIRIEHSYSINQDAVKVIVSSNGVIAAPVSKGWSAPRNGKPYVKSDGSSLTDCSCGFAIKDINKKIWVFGDSYCTIAFNRWMGKLGEAGYIEDIMLNAYPGESAAQNIPSLMNLINKGNPKAILWANGMNDGSDAGGPHAFWYNAVQVFITACESRGIIPILSTVPTVPSINNEDKNDWVRNSGYRYVDFAAAVGAQSDGTWFSGMLFSDLVHPTEAGATALFNRAIADCPEFMEY